MSLNNRDYMRSNSYTDVRSVSSFASKVYSWMSFGLLLTTVVCMFFYYTGIYQNTQSLAVVAALGAFVIGMSFNFLVKSASFTTLSILFLIYSVLEGVFLGVILPVYAAAYGGELIWMTFGTTALVFGIALFYGIFTKSDMTKLGAILRVALIGLVATTFLMFILSFFMDVTFMHLMICWAGLLIFVGLTAYDANKIKEMSYMAIDHSDESAKLSLVMAFRMYINVIMIFWYILQILSSRRK